MLMTLEDPLILKPCGETKVECDIGPGHSELVS